jgi:hypothetical protein
VHDHETAPTEASMTRTGNSEYYATHQATQKQIDFIETLLTEMANLGRKDDALDLFETLKNQAESNEFTMTQASIAITELKEKLKKLRVTKVEWPAVPTGRFAYQKSDDPDDVAFFHVVVKDNGFPLLWIYTPMEEIPVRGVPQKKAILQKIKDLGPFECELLFGQKIGKCSRCGTELTNPKSRAYGMGPDCRAK